MKCWLHISAGQGPAACQWVVARLLEVVRREASGLTMEILESEDGAESGTLRSVLVSLTGDGALDLARSLEGTVQWVGRSPFRPNHKRKNWFVGVFVLEPVEERDAELGELRVEPVTSGGPGGQHANRSLTAVRVTHVPTGLVVVAREERSQHMNRKMAISRIASALRSQAEGERAQAREQRWSHHHKVVRGNPVRVFRGARFESR